MPVKTAQSRQVSPRLALSRRAAAVAAGAALLLLGACDAIYEDTKGWANRLEASILQAAHEVGEADSNGKQGTPTATPEASETPPAVPLDTVDTAALPDSDQPMTAKGPAAASGTAGTGPAQDNADKPAPQAAEGLMAKTADGLKQAEGEQDGKPNEDAKPDAEQTAQEKAMPPKPLAKPAQSGQPDAKTEMAAEQAPTPEEAGDAAVAMVLHLSSLRSEDAAKREWSDLQRSFPDPLGQMQAEISRTELGDRGVYYRVLAGPLPSRDKAQQICADLKAKNARQYCRIMPSQPPS